MAIEILKANAHLASNIQFATIKPSITGYTRLETQPTSISMKTGLQAPLGDPLWMLARQWQFNEFQGEDAGTPLKLAFSVQGIAIDRFRAGLGEDQPWQTLTAGDAPIETRVEAEPVLKVHPRLRGEAGLQLLRMAPDADVRTALLNAYRLDLAAPTDPQADTAGELWSTVFSGRTVDASLVLTDLLPLLDADGKLTALPAALALAADAVATTTALETWYAWLQTLVVEGTDNPPAWRRERLEYTFALGGGNIVLKAEQYADGHVDWEDFQAETLAGDQAPAPTTREFKVTQRHPAPVRYPGMPAERYWEFEDGRVNFAGAEAGVTDLLRLSVTEFALSFGNDWFVTPVRLPVGWMYKVNNLEITDSFGVTSTSKPVQPTGNVPWYMYEMSAAGDVAKQLQHAIFVPDSLDGVTEGAVLEHTLLARDEMANLAWAIEKKVQGVSGEPLDRDMEAKALAFQQQIHFDELPDSPQLVYRLTTPVPANWTPLLPVRKSNTIDFAEPFEIQLERAGMKRFYPAPSVAVIGENDPAYTAFIETLEAQANFITALPIDPDLRAYVFYPRGWLLRKDPLQPMIASGDDADILRIEEEEIPRIGASLKRKFQYARSSDGKSWLWIGRSKLAGRGGAASNLRFDVAEKTHTFR
jgi:hypothetical protein